MTKPQVISHPIAPVFDENSRILILGSFPSVKSRQIGFYYGHPQNRFWPLLARIFSEQTPQTVESQHAFLLRNRIAVWDVIATCRIEGSADSSISDVVPNDLYPILEKADIREIYVNNLYTAAGSFTPLVTKALTGRVLSANEFSFVLEKLQAGSDPEVWNEVETQKNLADGTISFSAINCTLADIGVHTYRIRE